MRMSRAMNLCSLLASGVTCVATVAVTAAAQTPPSHEPQPPQAQQPQMPVVAASSVATVEVRVTGRYIGGRWVQNAALLEGPSRISISYGQPHARGREIMGKVVPFDTVWRLGANLATTLHTDLDITLGGTVLRRGTYSLFALPSKKGWQLVINRQTGQWGTEYDPSQDVARVPLAVRTLGEPVESLTIYLIPTLNPKGAPPSAPHGVLKIVWEKTELTAEWTVGG